MPGLGPANDRLRRLMLAPATSGLDEAIKVESAIATVAERQTGQFGGLRTVTAV